MNCYQKGLPTKWGKLEESYDIERNSDINDLHLMNENTRIYDQKVKIYPNLQFEEEKSTLIDQTSEVINAGRKIACQFTNKIIYPFMDQIGRATKKKLQSAAELLVEVIKNKPEQILNEEDEDNNLSQNWNIVISRNTPQEEVKLIKKISRESQDEANIEQLYNKQVISLKNMNENELQQSDQSFLRFVELQSQVSNKKEFELLSSNCYDQEQFRAALPILDDQEFDKMKRIESEIMNNKKEGSYSQEYYQQNDDVLNNQNIQDNNSVFYFPNNRYSLEQEQFLGQIQEKYQNYMKVIIPSIECKNAQKENKNQ